MIREFKPGDVAMVRQLGGGERLAIVGTYSRGAALAPPHFVYSNGGYDDVRGKAHDARPLVVIDPEDREQVERLRASLESMSFAAWACGSHTCLQAALRSLIEPPTPEEPTDPTARVADRRDNIWRLLADGEWVCTSGPDIGEYLAWDQLAGDRGPVSIEVAP